jgi:hypothetical protein
MYVRVCAHDAFTRLRVRVLMWCAMWIRCVCVCVCVRVVRAYMIRLKNPLRVSSDVIKVSDQSNQLGLFEPLSIATYSLSGVYRHLSRVFRPLSRVYRHLSWVYRPLP